MRPEMGGVLSQITLLEALVSRLIGGEDKGTGTGIKSNAEEVLLEAFTQVTEERNHLQEDKEHLNRQIQVLQRRVRELSQEAETLRQQPCKQTHTSGGTRENRLASGVCIKNIFSRSFPVFFFLFDY